MSEPKRTGLLQLLRESSGCQFVIPVYQRNYTWSADKEVKQYLDDLESVLKGGYKNHFMGIIIYLEKTIDFSSREFSIIDGQQRLTTTFLIIYAVRRLLEQSGDTEKIVQLEGQYLTNPYHSDKIKYKLKPLVSDDDVYRCIVENRMHEIADAKSNVLRNYQYISAFLDKLVIEGCSANDILLALDKLYVVCVPISEQDNAQKIFESINATGVKLTAADLVRNYLLMDLQSDIQEKYYTHYWKKLEKYISSDSKTLELFFRMYLAVKTYTLIAKNNIYREFVLWDKAHNFTPEELFEDLLEYARAFHILMYEEINKIDKKMRNGITDFRKINSDLPMSIIMEFYHLYSHQLINAQTMAELIESINSYMIRRSLCDINSQNISKLFPTVLKKVLEECDGDYSRIAAVLNQEMVGNNAGTSGSYMPNDKQMAELLYNANVYKRPALRIVLDRLELDHNPAPVDLSALSVEHLMPQTPTEEWIEELNVDMETYLENLHRLGNLTLATKPDNSRMGNLMWEYKNEVLKDTAHLTLNMEIIPIEKWDIEQIDKRTRGLIERICKLYPYPEVDIIRAHEDGIIDENTALSICIEKVFGGRQMTCFRKNRVYMSEDGKCGYVIASSKMYLQGEKEKFWFGYREVRFGEIGNCEDKYMLLVCRSYSVLVVKFPIDFIAGILNRLNISLDDDGNITHYHIVLFKNPNGQVTMMLSKPTIEEIDVSEYVVVR